MQMQEIAWGGWSRCLHLSNGTVELVVTLDVGPRIMAYQMTGGANVFWENPQWMGKNGGDKWVNYGGHRLWHAPEHRARTYAPDNAPIEVTQSGDKITFTQPIEASTGIQKALTVQFDPDDPAAVIVQGSLTNHGLWDVTLSAWMLSVMRAGGVSILPLPPRGSHTDNLLPNTGLIFWAYSDLSDPRWTWGREYVLLRQNPASQTPQKVGLQPGGPNWLAYLNDGTLFVKYPLQRYDMPGVPDTYPDRGCSLEIFTNAHMLELESLSPLVTLSPGHAVQHHERWTLHQGVAAIARDDDVQAHILPLIKSGV